MNKISIITPCFNASKYIGETIESVLSQTALINKTVELEYIICDGRSSDNTLDVIEETIKRHSNLNNNIKIISEKDSGMYDALSKGLRMVSGNICAYINSDDMYYRTAFEAVVAGMEIKNNAREINWLTGFSVQYNQYSQITNLTLPYKFRNKFIKQGLYGTKLPWIQQESTFWKSDLNAAIDLEALKSFKFAGDYYLWYTFANITNLYIMQTMLGGFRIREGQLSENIEEYYKEMNKIAEKSQIFLVPQIFLDKICGFVPNKIKRLLNKEIIYFDTMIHEWKMN